MFSDVTEGSNHTLLVMPIMMWPIMENGNIEIMPV